MANRAYLFSASSLDELSFTSYDCYYYDSRWIIPLAWLFFFTVNDIKITKESFRSSRWSEVKLASKKQDALATFAQRQSVLNHFICLPTARIKVEDFLTNISTWPGEYLLMDPEEIFEGEADKHVEVLQRIFATFDSSSIEVISELVCKLAGVLDPASQKYEARIFGYTYVENL